MHAYENMMFVLLGTEIHENPQLHMVVPESGVPTKGKIIISCFMHF